MLNIQEEIQEKMRNESFWGFREKPRENSKNFEKNFWKNSERLKEYLSEFFQNFFLEIGNFIKNSRKNSGINFKTVPGWTLGGNSEELWGKFRKSKKSSDMNGLGVIQIFISSSSAKNPWRTEGNRCKNTWWNAFRKFWRNSWKSSGKNPGENSGTSPWNSYGYNQW